MFGSKREKKVSVPESLLDVARSAGKKHDEEKEKQKRKWAREQRKKELEQERRRKEALPYATKVYNWAEEFRCSKEGRELIRQGEKHESLDGGIFLWTDKLPHQPTRYIGVSPGGVWYMNYGCGARPILVTRGPSELANEVPAPILEAAWESFQNGAVWDLISSRIERPLK